MALDIQGWLATSNTSDPMHNTAVIEAAFGVALAQAATTMNATLGNVTDQLTAINQFSDLLRSKLPPGLPTDVGQLGADKDKIISLMNAYCPNIDTTIANGGSLQQGQINTWLEALQGAVTDLNTSAQKQNTRISSVVDGYGNAFQFASNEIKAGQQASDNADGNIRSAQ